MNRAKLKIAGSAPLACVLLLGAFIPFTSARADSVDVPASLPTARSTTSAVWDGTHAYIFGGYRGTRLNEIVRYNPSTGEATTVATLPTARWGTSAVWDGSNAYIFGGCPSGCPGAVPASDQIVRYNPATNTSEVVASMNRGLMRSASIWDGNKYAYIFGGTDRILRFEPAVGAVTVMQERFPAPRFGVSAAWDGENAYIFGGETLSLCLSCGLVSTGELNDVARYSPGSDKLTTMSATLPTARWDTSAVWAATGALVFGGEDPEYLSQIVRYRLTPGAPQQLSASSGPAAGEVILSWNPPPHNTYSSPIGFRIYRGNQPGQESLIAEVGEVLAFSDIGLTPGTTYHYLVSAVHSTGGEGPKSNGSSTVPFSATAPRNLTSTPGPGKNQVTLAWQEPASVAGTLSNYRVYRSTGGPEALIAEPNGTGYTDVTCPAVCFYRVSAVAGTLEGLKSDSIPGLIKLV